MDSVPDQSVIDSINDTPPTDFEKSSRSLNVFLFVFGSFLIILFVIMLQFFQQKPSNERVSTVESPTPEITKVEDLQIVNDTNNWKTYDSGDFSFQYPSQLEIEPKGSQQILFFQSQSKHEPTDLVLNIGLQSGSDALINPQGYVDSSGREWIISDPMAIDGAYNFTANRIEKDVNQNVSIQVGTIAFEKFLEKKLSKDLGDGKYDDSQFREEHLKLAKQILSTFKFADKKISSIKRVYTGESFVYQNSVYSGYSFEYPETCSLSSTALNCSLTHGIGVIMINAGGHGYGIFESKSIKNNETKIIPAGEGKISLIEDVKAKTVLGTYWINKTDKLTQSPIFGFEFRDIPTEDLIEFEQLFDQLVSTLTFLD